VSNPTGCIQPGGREGGISRPSKGPNDKEQDQKKPENGAPDGGTNLFPQNQAATKPRSFQIARTALHYPEKSRYNQSVYKIQSNDVASKGPMTPNEITKRR
jgi:hypothetical protein